MKIEGVTAVVTGGASGVGFGISSCLAKKRAKLILLDISKEALDSAVMELRKCGARVEGYCVDVSQFAEVKAIANVILTEHGRVDLLVNNAGVALHGDAICDIQERDWRWIFDVNVLGVVACSQAFVPAMQSSGQEAFVVNVASVGGFVVNEQWRTSAYAATKHAVVALTEALRNDLRGSRVRVALFSPDTVNTRLHLSSECRPERYGGKHERPQQEFMREILQTGVEPLVAGRRLVEALENNESLIFMSGLLAPRFAQRQATIFDALLTGAVWATTSLQQDRTES